MAQVKLGVSYTTIVQLQWLTVFIASKKYGLLQLNLYDNDGANAITL